MYKNYFKRLFDFTAALVGLLLLSPIFLVVTIGLFFVNQGKPFFLQLRPGKNGRLFKIIKFKTMRDIKIIQGQLISEDEDKNRLTLIGRFVRNTSLDEIPQLLNVLKGDMSLIGPRPLLPEYLPLYNAEQKRRHEVRPGITGWAQVNGRNAISWQQKFKYDVWYVDNISLSMDIKIILKTLKKVVKKEQIDIPKSVKISYYFEGNE